MSYDLVFLPKTAGQSWEEAIVAAEKADVGGQPDPAAWERIVAAARPILGEFSTRRGEDYFELDHGPSRVQVHLFAGEAGITAPYWFTGLDATALVDLVFRLGRAVETATGLVGYDPQLDVSLAEAEVERAVEAFDAVGAMAVRGTVLRPDRP